MESKLRAQRPEAFLVHSRLMIDCNAPARRAATGYRRHHTPKHRRLARPRNRRCRASTSAVQGTRTADLATNPLSQALHADT
jgi:hypothetical protein